MEPTVVTRCSYESWLASTVESSVRVRAFSAVFARVRRTRDHLWKQLL